MFRRSFYAFAFAIGAILIASSSLLADDVKVGPISVSDAWSRATPGGAQVAAGYLTIKNDGNASDRLVSATAAIAGKTEIHQMSMVDGVMKMRQLTDGLPVAGKGSVVLEPSSNHLMFMDLKGPLKEGEQFAGSLTFEHAGTVDVTFHVRGIGAAAP